MPYIKKEQRKRFKDLLDMLAEANIGTPGELNYVITVIILDYFNAHAANYQAANDIVGSIEAAKLELYRRVIGPYEDKKIKENGDI